MALFFTFIFNLFKNKNVRIMTKHVAMFAYIYMLMLGR